MPYIGASPSSGVRRVFDYTATAGQTSFSGSDNNSQTLAYTDSAYIDVFQNGVLLIPSDYTATTGTSVVLDTGATVSDSVQIVVFDVFSVADTVSAANGGTFEGNISIGGTLGVTGVTTFSAKPVGTGMDFLQSVTASDDATVEIGSASLFTTTYRTYILYYSNLHVGTDNVNTHIRFGIGGSIKSDSYYDFTRQVKYDGANNQTDQSGNNEQQLTNAIGQSRGNATGEQSSGYIMIYDPASTDNYKHINVFNTGDDLNSDTTMSILGGRYNNGQAALTSIQFLVSSGNIASGYFRLYGIA